MKVLVKKFSLLAIIALFAIAFIGCNGDETTTGGETTVDPTDLFESIPNQVIIDGSDSITGNFKLPGEVNDVTITYESDHPEIVAFSDDTDEDGFYDVVVTTPNALEGGEDTSVIITGTMSYAGETETFTKTIRVIAQNILVFDDIADVHATAETDDLVYATGVVYSLFSGGFFITDGTGFLGVYDGSLEVEIGDEVFVKGPYAFYYTMPQIDGTSEFELLSSGNTPDVEPVEVTNPAIVRELDSDNDPTIPGTVYTITGEVWIGGDYDNVHIMDPEGDIGVQIYYSSPADSITALEAHDGEIVTIDITYYTDHGDVIYAVFDGAEADITELTTNAEMAQYYADSIYLDGTFIKGGTIDLPEMIGDQDITWSEGTGETNVTVDGNVATISDELTDTTDITLTASVTYEGETATSDITITALSYTATELVQMDKADLVIEYDTVEQLDVLELPANGQWGSELNWTVMVSDNGFLLNDNGTEIVVDYTGTAGTITVIAEIINDDVSDTKQFEINTTVPDLTDITDVVSGDEGNEYVVQGVIYYAIQNGYYVQDGTDKIFVYNGSNIDVTIGDEVVVKGELGSYKGSVQLTDPVMSSTISADNDVAQTSQGSDISDPASGYTYTLTGTLKYGVEEDISSYDNLYLLDDSENVITFFYYKNLEAPYDTLTALDGVKVTIDAVYYNYDVVPSFVWMGSEEDITVAGTDAEKAATAIDYIEAGTPSSITEAQTLFFPDTLFGVDMAYASDNTDFIANDGTVTLPEAGLQEVVTVTVTATLNSEILTTDLVITVGELTVIDIATACGEAYQDQKVKIQGVVTSGEYNDLYFIQDDTGGVAVYAPYWADWGGDLDDFFNDNLGKEVTLVGFMDSYSGLIQLADVGSEDGSYEVVGDADMPAATNIDDIALTETDLLDYQGLIVELTSMLAVNVSGSDSKTITFVRLDTGEEIVMDHNKYSIVSTEAQTLLDSIIEGNVYDIQNVLSWDDGPLLGFNNNTTLTDVTADLTDAQKLSIASLEFPETTGLTADADLPALPYSVTYDSVSVSTELDSNLTYDDVSDSFTVSRPAAGSADVTGTVTITIELNGATEDIIIDVTIPAFATELFISEYIEGSSNNKALELYNDTEASIDLSGYKLVVYSNGNTDYGNNMTLSGTLAPGETYVVYNSSADTAIADVGDATSTVTYFNGNDAVALLDAADDSVIDLLGVIGDDSYFGGGVTLVRDPAVNGPSATFDMNEWIEYGEDYFDDLGTHR